MERAATLDSYLANGGISSSERSARSTRVICSASWPGAKIRHAKVLLANTDKTLAVIANAIGCGTPQYFSELFHEATGVPPAEWRARIRGGTTDED